VRKPLGLAAGFFDGLHRGHREVLRRTLAAARRAGGEAWVLTFDKHPLKVLDPARAPRLLTSTAHKIRLMEEMGLDGCLVVPFTLRLSRQTPEAFVEQLCRNAPTLKRVLVGDNWRFGLRGRGDAQLLQQLGKARGFGVSVVKPVVDRGVPVSSTRIRNAVERGRLDEAAALLGRRFSILGTVIRGRRLGRTLGYPTANLAPHNEVMPLPGVYAVKALVRGQELGGVLNFGFRPTFDRGAQRPVLELHLFDFGDNLYGKTVEVTFIKRLRGERRFRSAAELSMRIAADVRAARRCLAAV
jgi:riboflavin kinase/FMN adenylyltransferase